jgi:glutaredoxin
MKKALPIIIFILLIAVVIIVGMKMNKNNSSENNSANNVTSEEGNEVKDTSGIDAVSLAKHLTEVGAIFYGAYWCPHCQDQKKLFGDAMQYVTYYECDPKGENSKAEACQAAGIESYPTWIINGQKYSGLQTFANLAKYSSYTK